MFQERFGKTTANKEQQAKLLALDNYDLAQDLGNAGVLKQVETSREKLRNQTQNPNLQAEQQAQFEQQKAQVTVALNFVKQHNFKAGSNNWVFPKNDLLKLIAANSPQISTYINEKKATGEFTENDVLKLSAIDPLQAQQMLLFKSAMEAWNKINSPSVVGTDLIPLITNTGKSYPSEVGKIRGNNAKIEQFVFQPILEYVAKNQAIFSKNS